MWVRLYLPDPVFAHDQLYVAVSRCTSRKGLKMMIGSYSSTSVPMTRNVVIRGGHQRSFTNDIRFTVRHCRIKLFTKTTFSFQIKSKMTRGLSNQSCVTYFYIEFLSFGRRPDKYYLVLIKVQEVNLGWPPTHFWRDIFTSPWLPWEEGVCGSW